MQIDTESFQNLRRRSLSVWQPKEALDSWLSTECTRKALTKLSRYILWYAFEDTVSFKFFRQELELYTKKQVEIEQLSSEKENLNKQLSRLLDKNKGMWIKVDFLRSKDMNLKS